MAEELSLVVAFGSDMGNAEDAAMSFAEAVEEAVGVAVRAIELNQVDIADLCSATHFIVVTSTFGDGEFPDNAALFWEAFSADGVDRLDHLRFAVLALGDSSYELFCNAGRLVDERLDELGAIRLVERVDIDGFYEQPAAAWTADVVKLLVAEGDTPGRAAIATASNVDPTPDAQHHDLAYQPNGGDPPHPAPPRLRSPQPNGGDPPHPAPPRLRSPQPVPARVTVNRLLTAAASDKEVRHYEVDLTDSGISYTAGDSIAVHAPNDPTLVEQILTELGVGPEHRVDDHDEPVGVLLTDRLDIRTPSRALRALVATRIQDPDTVAALRGDAVAAAGSWLYGKDVLDLIRLGQLGRSDADEVVDTLRPLQFRDYSIASSPLVHPDQVHLTVATVRYANGDRRYGGLASTFLADRADTARVHLRPNHSFRLPAGDMPIIMIGPGTGIAPFRGFLQERQAEDARGRSWLFFGDRRRATDFLYGDELDAFHKSGTLTRLNLAFSRDGRANEPKYYVQQRMWENAAELFGWIEDGAHIYVCGDAERMAKDVDAALHGIVAHCGNLDADAAHTYVNQLIKEHRYLRDVY